MEIELYKVNHVTSCTYSIGISLDILLLVPVSAQLALPKNGAIFHLSHFVGHRVIPNQDFHLIKNTHFDWLYSLLIPLSKWVTTLVISMG